MNQKINFDNVNNLRSSLERDLNHLNLQLHQLTNKDDPDETPTEMCIDALKIAYLCEAIDNMKYNIKTIDLLFIDELINQALSGNDELCG